MPVRAPVIRTTGLLIALLLAFSLAAAPGNTTIPPKYLPGSCRGQPDSDELSERSGLTGVNHFVRALITQSTPHRVRALELLALNRRRSAPWAPRSARSRRQFLRPP